MKDSKRWMQMILAIMIACIGLQISCKSVDKPGNKPGVTATTFNRRFLPTIKPHMTYEEIEKIAGAPGAKVGENKDAAPPMVQYRWNGSKDSVLTVQFRKNEGFEKRHSDYLMKDATVLAPNGHTYLIQDNGEIADITK
jgi:hypothetical protein